MAASGAAGARQPRRGPAPIASFDHDGSDESSPEGRAAAVRLPGIHEDARPCALAPPAPEPRARSHSTPGGAPGTLGAGAPRIDISRASSSSHHDSRDSSPELALFAAGGGLALGFREDGALDLRSSTEELAFLEPAPPGPALPAPAPPAPAPPPPPGERRHSRKDSQSSEAALLAVSGRTSRLSSVGSQCSALSRVSRLSVASAASRSPSPHRMLLETSFCGPKPIETDPEISASALVDQILGLVDDAPPAPTPAVSPPAPALPVDARDRREVRTEVTVESARPPTAAPPAPSAPALPGPGERRARPRLRREPSEPEVYKSRNKTKDIIRIKLRPDDSYEEEEGTCEEAARKPASLEVGEPARPAPAPAPGPRSPSPNPAVSRKSSFCSLFKSRETIASPESPSDALRRKRSLTEGRPRSASRDRSGTGRDRSGTPTSGHKVRGSVLSLFRTPRRSLGGEHEPRERDRSPAAQGAPHLPAHAHDRRRLDSLKYYEDTKDGIIHIPLRTPPDERPRRSSGAEATEPARAAEGAPRDPRPASAPQPRAPLDPRPADPAPPPPSSKPIRRTVLPDGSIIIPLHSPTERPPEPQFADTSREPEPTEAPVPCGTITTPMPTAAAESAPPPAVAVGGEGAPLPTAAVEGAEGRTRRKERLVFTTHVGSREQVFSTQFSITKTPSLSSEISGSLPSFEGELPAPLRDTHIAAAAPPAAPASPGTGPAAEGGARDSSESEPSSEAAPSRAGNDVEKRILVVAQESFEEELPWVPTTLPQERSVAVPMVPVRERGGVRVSGVQRPRAAAPPLPPPAPAPPPPRPAPADKLNIKLPRRPRAPAAPPDNTRTTSAGDTTGSESRSKSQWIDFEEVPERRKQPKRIQTLPAAAGGGPAPPAGAPLVFNYVEPEHCRCECHARGDTEDQLPLLTDHMRASVISSSSAECGESGPLSATSPTPADPPAPGAARAGPS